MADAKTVFLGSARIHGTYDECIRGARSRLVMVIPWFTPSPQLKDTLFGMLERKVAFTLVTRPPSEARNPAHEAALLELLSRQRASEGRRGFLGLGKRQSGEQVEIVLVRNVHAKMIVQDEEVAVVSSSNLNTMSVARNTEFGMLSRERQVVRDALDAIQALRVSDRSSTTSNGGIRRCDCGGWIFEKEHDVCRSCFLGARGAGKMSEGEGASSGGEEAAGQREEEPEPAGGDGSSPSPPSKDPMVCPICGGRKLKREHAVCRTCYRAGKRFATDKAPPAGEAKAGESEVSIADDDGLTCPRCGGRKMRKQDRLCRTCYYAEKRG